ncbi:MAG: hypothetical protein HC866_21480 [Leptolyngbyaceae cyanobacterium RU_5_1]|nr:hypothetical protein [Leptolyngbyaceae cyanobacterium RU_5_1]
MSRKLALLLTILLWSGSSLLLPGAASAETLLNRATVQQLRNTVRLILQNQQPRTAKVKDNLTPGDALTTAHNSLAELRFNDKSLARIGEQALFQFLPNTRTLKLSKGTVLLLIPPKQGRTRVRTPNAAAGIRGSALFVRYVPETDTTLVGALTNSGIEVFNRDQSQNQTLQAGQIAVIARDKIERVYTFDLRTFYQTSELVKGLDLLVENKALDRSDAAIAAVQAEIAEGLNSQQAIATKATVQIPNLLSPASTGNFSPTGALPPVSLPTATSPSFSAPTSALTKPGSQPLQPASAQNSPVGVGNSISSTPGSNGTLPGSPENTPGPSIGIGPSPSNGPASGGSSGQTGSPGQAGTSREGINLTIPGLVNVNLLGNEASNQTGKVNVSAPGLVNVNLFGGKK